MSDERDIRAAEYVLGLHDVAGRAAFAREIERDPALRAAVADWERRLSPLALSAPDELPPPDMLARIRASLPVAGESGEVVALRRAVRRWRGIAAASGAITAALLLFAGERIWREAQSPGVYVAAINRGGAAPALIVRVDIGAGRVIVRPVAAETPAGKSLELWYIDDGAAPRSMGLVGAGAESLPLPGGARPEKAKFAVTVEPPGGSPTGGPTGPVVYSGELIRE